MSQAASQTQQQALDIPSDLPIARAPSKAIGRILWLEAAILLAIVQVLFAGYRMGVGNQTIQIPFLKQWHNPQLYANDPMVAGTLAVFTGLESVFDLCVGCVVYTYIALPLFGPATK